MIFSIYIINKAGGLVYNKDYSEGLSKLTSNEYLVLAGTFHGYGLVIWSQMMGKVGGISCYLSTKRIFNAFEPVVVSTLLHPRSRQYQDPAASKCSRQNRSGYIAFRP